VKTIAEQIVDALADLGVRQIWGVVGDALNPVTDAIRRDERLEWIGVRHEEVGAFAASAQAQLTGTLGVCMGTVGPGSIHLLNGLYDAKKSHAPVLAICGQVPMAELGSDYFQEVDNDLLFRDVAAFTRSVTAPEQMPRLLVQAVRSAYAAGGVAVLTLPGDIGSMSAVTDAVPSLRPVRGELSPPEDTLQQAAELIDNAERVTLLVGAGARAARADVLELAERLSAPMVLTLKGKDGLEHDNPYQVGQSGLIGNPASRKAFDAADLLLMIGTDFPYPEWLPDDATVIQLDSRAEHIGRRTPVDLALVGDADPTARRLCALVSPKTNRAHLDSAREDYEEWNTRQRRLTDPDHDQSLVGRIRARFDNPDDGIRPEALAMLIDEYASPTAIFTADTGMSTVWLSRFVQMHEGRRMIGSFNLGSMANALPQALGAQASDRGREVVALCGDGGLTMLLGDLITSVSHRLPVKVFVFDNGRLGMVKLEQEQGGLPEFGTVLANPDLAAVAAAIGLTGIRVEDPAELSDAVRRAFEAPGPVLVDVVTNPDEIALPPKTTASDAWGFAIAKIREGLVSPGDRN
jgi:pyruvate dehydrogenase (quinone)